MESNQVNAQMGYSVRGAGDVNGDGYSDVIVASPLFDKGEQDEGVVFVYHGSAVGVNINAVATIEINQAGAVFGWSVSGAGDINGDGYGDVIAGAPLYDNGQTNEGAVFVYNGSAAGLSTQAVKTLEGNQIGGQMGHALAAAGDVNGDGYADVVIGAYQYDKGQLNEGVGAVYQGSAQGLGGVASSVLDGDQAEGRMGFSIASAGDVNGDGYSDIVVGAPLFDKGQGDEGAAFVWHGMAGGISLLVKLESDQLDSFAKDVAGAGDINGDGYDDIIIGTPYFDKGELDEGIALVYYGSESGIKSTTVQTLEINQAGAILGHTVSGAGDVNGDGYDDVIVGAPGYDNGQDAEGGAFVYFGSISGLNLQTKTTLEGDQSLAQFGMSVASAGDVNGDGFGDIIVGSYLYDHDQFNEGAAFIYYGSSLGIKAINKKIIESNQISAQFGVAVAGAGDVNGDGYGDIIVGSYLYDKGQVDEGSAFVFYGSVVGISSNSFSVLESNQASAHMGLSVASAGDLNGDGIADIVVGVPYYSQGQSEEGAAFVWYGTSDGVNLSSPVVLQSNTADANMGYSVSNAGDINDDGYTDLLVGSPLLGNGNSNEGAAFLFIGSSTGINQIPLLVIEGNETNAMFGQSVSFAGDINGDGHSDLIIGACSYITGKGYASIYNGNSGNNLKNNSRLYNADLTTPISQTQFPQNNFGASLYAKSFLGGNKGKLVWETKSKGQGFSKGANDLITNSTLSTGSQNAYTYLNLQGTELKNLIAKQGTSTKVRVRVKYDPALALTGQTYGPWRYLPAYLNGSSIAPVPEGAMAETIERKAFTEKLDLVQINTFPNPVSEKLFIKYSDAEKIHSLDLLTTMGKSVYRSGQMQDEIDVRKLPDGMYMLIVTKMDGSKNSHKVVIRH